MIALLIIRSDQLCNIADGETTSAFLAPVRWRSVQKLGMRSASTARDFQCHLPLPPRCARRTRPRPLIGRALALAIVLWPVAGNLPAQRLDDVPLHALETFFVDGRSKRFRVKCCLTLSFHDENMRLCNEKLFDTESCCFIKTML